MRITSLQVENLLSFTSFDLPFQQGLNVIVGPNGTGKSNVVRLVGLIRAALEIAVGVSQARIDVRRYLRIGASSRRGRVALGIELTEEDEWGLVVSYVRALVASSLDRKSAEFSSVDAGLEQLLAARVRQAVDRAQTESLLRGRLVLWLDAGPPEAIGFAYEFDHGGATYHYGITGAGIPTDWVGVGPATLSRRASWGGQPLDLSQFLSGCESSSFAFSHVLPAAGRLVTWDVKNHPTGQQLLLSEELARALGADPEPSRALSFRHVLYRAVHDRLVLTENLRRPPRAVYELSESSAPPALEDAGDLPLELYRRKVGQEPADRRAFRAVQQLFRELTGDEVDVTARIAPAPTIAVARFTPQLTSATEYPATMAFQQDADPPAYRLHIEAVVPVGDGQVPVQHAGAGVWETLVASTFAVRVTGRVLLLDEPAVNLHPSWQRRLLTQLASLDQVVLITHSPYLVPGSTVENLRRINRLYPTSAGTKNANLMAATIPDDWLARWRQELAASADARAALFARGVILVEGDTDFGAFSTWFSDLTVVGSGSNTYDGHNLSLIVAGSDTSFGAWISYLQTFAIPWVILCDGPVLSPEHKVSLLEQLPHAGFALGAVPDRGAQFADWKTFWEGHRVFTVADSFGGVRNDRDKSGEIEAFFGRIDARQWQATVQRYPKSKTRAGYAFAEEIDLTAHQQQLQELQQLWKAVVDRLTA